MAVELQIGDRWQTNVEFEARDANGSLLARYKPGLGYEYTARNKQYVDPYITTGNVTPLNRKLGGAQVAIGAGPSEFKAKVTMNEKKEG